LLTASSDKQARIWDVATGTAILATREHADEVFSVLFLPGEELFLVSTRNGQITVWDSRYGKMIAPSRQLPNRVLQLSLSEVGHKVFASGERHPIRGFDWKQWILEPDTHLSRADVKLLGEIVSSQRVHEGGAATRLTSDQWLKRWNEFREKHPDQSLR
jgi:WD40 repeat protein